MSHVLSRQWVHWGLLVVILLGSLALPATSSSAAAQPVGVVSGIDVNRVPGVEEAVGRSFDSQDGSQTAGIGHLEFAVLAFADAAAAQAALPDVFGALTPVLRQSSQPATPPPLGENALAWTASGPASLSVAILLVQDRSYIHVFTAVAESGPPLDALAAIASHTVDRSGTGAAVVQSAGATATPQNASGRRSLTEGELWNLLPNYGDLPGPFGLYAEESWPGEPIPGVPPVPDPDDCTVEPRARSEFETVTPASPPGSSSPPPGATPVTIATPLGNAPADAATVEAVTATAHEVTACSALGDWPRAYALYTDRYFREQVALLDPQIIEFIFSGQTFPVAEGPRLVEVRNVQILPDGRIGAVVETVTVTGNQPLRETAFMWFVQEGDGVRIDGIAPLEQSDEATPAPD